MNKQIAFLVVGGDLRQVYLAESLATNANINMYTIGLDKN